MTPLKSILAASAITLGLIGTAAIAQPYYGDEAPAAYADEAPATVPGITVYAPRTVGRSSIGAPIQVVSEQVVVPTADLDLSTYWGMNALRDRVRHAAYDACQDLNDRYPASAEGDDCYGLAVRRAYEQVAYQTGYAP